MIAIPGVHDKLATILNVDYRALRSYGFPGSLQQAGLAMIQIGMRGAITYPRGKTDVIAKLPLASLLLKPTRRMICWLSGQPNCGRNRLRVFDVLCELCPEP